MNHLPRNSTRLWPAVLGAAALILTLCAPASAEIYKWTDSDGNINFADNLFDVPQQYLDQISTYKETTYENNGEIPLSRTEMGYVIQAKVNGGDEIRLLIDTGANVTVVSPEALRKSRVKIPTRNDVKVRTAGGEVSAAMVEVTSISVGAFKKGPMKVVAHKALDGVDGLLGMDFLESYRFEILTAAPALKLTTK